MPYADSFGVQVPPTGIGLLDMLLRMIHRDPFGGFGTVLGDAPAVNLVAQNIRPGIFQSLARRPEEFHFLENQPGVLGSQGSGGYAQTGSLDELREWFGMHDLARMFGTPWPSMAPPGSTVTQFAPWSYIPKRDLSDIAPHEVGHLLQFLQGRFGVPSPAVQSRLANLPLPPGVRSYADVGEQATQRLGQFYKQP